MARWLPPNHHREVIYNDCVDGRFASLVVDIETGATRQLPFPIYDLTDDGRYAAAPNFARIHDHRPGYGYNGPPDPNEDVLCPDNDGVWRLDILTGEVTLIATIVELAALQPDPEFDAKPQWLNHVQINPSGSRIAVLHRCRTPERDIRSTRLFTMNPDGSDKRCLAHHEHFSHYDWFDDEHLLGWARRPDSEARNYVLYTDRSDRFRVVGNGVLTADGHCSLSPDRRWLLTDTYARSDQRRTVILYRWPDGPRIDVGRFFSPPQYQGEFRCDLHPRWSRDGTTVCIDSAHEDGRQVHVLDVSEVVGRNG
jgi:hypothetical protein